jgi:hypothetical protein
MTNPPPSYSDRQLRTLEVIQRASMARIAFWVVLVLFTLVLGLGRVLRILDLDRQVGKGRADPGRRHVGPQLSVDCAILVRSKLSRGDRIGQGWALGGPRNTPVSDSLDLQRSFDILPLLGEWVERINSASRKGPAGRRFRACAPCDSCYLFVTFPVGSDS